jgi:predicted lysophospholipase L1 biosynthesis ABC-type transport system permease subunit
MGPRDRWATVAGVVGDTRFRDFLEPRPTVYLAFGQFPAPPSFLAVRVAGDPPWRRRGAPRRGRGRARGARRRERHDARLAAAPLARPRLLSAVLGAYALVTVLLAVAGLYAVVAGAVAQRGREFGVRSALGASPGALRALVLGEGLGVALVGAAVGLAGALAASRLVGAVVHGVSPTDPPTLVASAAALVGVCAAAALLPARRAARTDPAVVLRAE